MNEHQPFEATMEYAEGLDAADPLRPMRAQFRLPQDDRGNDAIYLCGNSLGLQPQRAAQYVQQELDDWARLGVDGHLKARRPWLSYHRQATAGLASLCGAKPAEVVAMNTLTVNLHLLMASFYRPTQHRCKIVIESLAFPSDRFAAQSQLQLHGFDPGKNLLEWAPHGGSQELHIDDLRALLDKHGDEVALLLLPGVQYYSGQVLDMAKICRLARDAGCAVGLDLAHAIGNVPLALHDWAPDFAAWCSYKYLNGGPGAIAGAFVHERHLGGDASRTLLGWWGNREQTRFRMKPEFEPETTAELWQLSNPPVLSLAPVIASLSLFDEAGIGPLRAKSLRLTGFLDFLLQQRVPDRVSSITPPDARGCQMSLVVKPGSGTARAVFDRLTAQHVVADWREPDAIRVAPVPRTTVTRTYTDSLSGSSGRWPNECRTPRRQ
ncbi:MAG: kynureninase [Woeseiaceae bacterium]|nr:kynureninase [Woeseiaceae bacterium]